MADEKMAPAMPGGTCGDCRVWQKWDGDSVVENGVTKRRCWDVRSIYVWEWRASKDPACEAIKNDD